MYKEQKRNAKTVFAFTFLPLRLYVHALHFYTHTCTLYTNKQTYMTCFVYYFSLPPSSSSASSIDELYVHGLILSAYLYFVNCMVFHVMSWRAMTLSKPDLSTNIATYFFSSTLCDWKKTTFFVLVRLKIEAKNIPYAICK